MAPTFPPNLCPLCGTGNQCAMEIARRTGVKQAPCWCTGVTFDADLLAKVPAAARNLACICQHCAAAAGNAGNAG